MNIKLTTYEEKIERLKYQSYTCELEIHGVNPNDLMEGLEQEDRREIIGAFRPDEIVTFNDVESILEAIGIDRIKQYLIEHD